MRILVTGGKGMLGRTLGRELAGHEIFVADLPETDMLDVRSLGAAFSAFRPQAVVHCAAMTKVDDCETSRDLAYRLNEEGSRNVAAACREAGARLIAISTDYVFSGDAAGATADDAHGEGWRETDTPAPRTVYGASNFPASAPCSPSCRVRQCCGSPGCTARADRVSCTQWPGLAHRTESR